MSELYKTNLFLQGAPLPQGFKGTPQQWYESILERIRIVAPFGFSTIVIGSLKPTSNQGPWLKDGTQWYVWDVNETDYVPLDISQSATPPYYVQTADPAGTPDSEGNYPTEGDEGWQENGPLGSGPLLWFRLNSGETGVDGMFIFIRGRWQSLLQSGGATEDRPTSPANWEQYYDTTISTLLHWERGAWRTVDGCRGDLKYVSWPTAEEALQFNPGWEIFGTGESADTTLRGRFLVMATKNAGGSPSTRLEVVGGISEKSAGVLGGEESHILIDSEVPTGTLRAGAAGTGLGLYSPSTSIAQQYGGGGAHNNMPPHYNAWLLRKT